jgi:hypothetical protein
LNPSDFSKSEPLINQRRQNWDSSLNQRRIIFSDVSSEDSIDLLIQENNQSNQQHQSSMTFSSDEDDSEEIFHITPSSQFIPLNLKATFKIITKEDLDLFQSA